MESEQTNSQSAARMAFPETLWTVVFTAAGAEDQHKAREALAKLAGYYRRVVVQCLLVLGVNPNEVEDYAHDFLVKLVEGKVLTSFERRPTRFRNFLFICVRNFVADQHRIRMSKKRGSGTTPLHLEPHTVEAAESEQPAILDETFARTVQERAFEQVRQLWAGKHAERFTALKRFTLGSPEPGDYEAAARQLGVTTGLVRKTVCELREAFYDALRREVAQVTPRDEIDAELRYVITVLGRTMQG